jgi:hypothetical protein
MDTVSGQELWKFKSIEMQMAMVHFKNTFKNEMINCTLGNVLFKLRRIFWLSFTAAIIKLR